MAAHVLSVLGLIWVCGLFLWALNRVWAAIVVRNRHKWLERRNGGDD